MLSGTIRPVMDSLSADERSQKLARVQETLMPHQKRLKELWDHEIAHTHLTDSNNHAFPLARIKKIMKADDDVRTISAEAPVLFAKACELFILETTIRAWMYAELHQRKTLVRSDVVRCVENTPNLDFLRELVCSEDCADDDGDEPELASINPNLWVAEASDSKGSVRGVNGSSVQA